MPRRCRNFSAGEQHALSALAVRHVQVACAWTLAGRRGRNSLAIICCCCNRCDRVALRWRQRPQHYLSSRLLCCCTQSDSTQSDRMDRGLCSPAWCLHVSASPACLFQQEQKRREEKTCALSAPVQTVRRCPRLAEHSTNGAPSPQTDEQQCHPQLVPPPLLRFRERSRVRPTKGGATAPGMFQSWDRTQRHAHLRGRVGTAHTPYVHTLTCTHTRTHTDTKTLAAARPAGGTAACRLRCCRTPPKRTLTCWHRTWP